jgi:hypothetical protein
VGRDLQHNISSRAWLEPGIFHIPKLQFCKGRDFDLYTENLHPVLNRNWTSDTEWISSQCLPGDHQFPTVLSVLFCALPCFFPWRRGGSGPSVDACLYASILRIPQMSLESDGGMIYWQRKTEELRGKPVPVPLCPPQIPHGLTRARTQASVVRGRRLTTWAMAQPALSC